MDDTDRRIIAALVGGLPDSPTPWADAARDLGLEPGELLRRLEHMRDEGLLRGVRAVLDPRALGLAGNVLVAWSVPAERTDEVGRLFASRSEVSHCVLRDTAPGWDYNLDPMIHARTPGRCEAVVGEMQRASGVTARAVLPTVRELKKTAPRYFG